MTASPLDAYFHKTVALRAGSRRVELATSQQLFSAHQVDRGSRLLLRVVTSTVEDMLEGRSVLDVGCGYGALGLGTLALGASEATLVDRDALAVWYSRWNATSNGLDGATAFGSTGYDDVGGTFDVIVSNIPGHADEAVVDHFVTGAGARLRPTGAAAFVVVSSLAPVVEASLATAGAEVLRMVDDRGHSVWVAGGLAAAGERRADLYTRGRHGFAAGRLEWTAETAQGVPEFDSLSRHTRALLDNLDRVIGEPRSVAVWNPGQGHVPVWLWLRHRPARLLLCDRDLVALRYSRTNLTVAGARQESVHLEHTVDLAGAPVEAADLYVDILRRSEPAAASAARIEAARIALGVPVCVVAGDATRLGRVARELEERGLRTAGVGRRGASVLEVKR